MATARLPLSILGGVAPDGTGTGNNPATPEKVVSSGTQTTNSSKASYIQLLFDPTTDEHWMWAFELPGDYSSGGTIRLKYTNKGTSANGVVWKAAAAIATSGTTDLDAIVFDTVVTTNSTPNTTTGRPVEATLDLTMTNASANRQMVLMIGRDPNHASDTNASDMALVGATFEFQTA